MAALLDPGVISAAIVTLGGGGIALYIHWRRRKDDRAEKVRRKADAHKELWHILQQMKAQAERPNVKDEATHYMEDDDGPRLRMHFRDNAALLSEELHKEYTDYLKRYNRPTISKHYGPREVDFAAMQHVAKDEWRRYERKYESMGGDPVI